MSKPLSWYQNTSNFESVARQLRVWLDDDPLVPPRNYAGMDDAGVETDMRNDMTEIGRTDVTGLELFGCTDGDELIALRNGTLATGAKFPPGHAEQGEIDAATQQADYSLWVSGYCQADRVYERSGPIVKVMRDVWGNTSKTWDNLVQYYESEKVDRGTWLRGRPVSTQDVTTARALPATAATKAEAPR